MGLLFEEEDEDEEILESENHVFITQYFFIDTNRIYFHLSNLPSIRDPWDFNFCDYSVLMDGWKEFPPPWMEFGSKIKANQESEDGRSSQRSSRRSNRKNRKYSQEKWYEDTLAQIATDPTLGKTMGKNMPVDKASQERLDFLTNIVKDFNTGKNAKDIAKGLDNG